MRLHRYLRGRAIGVLLLAMSVQLGRAATITPNELSHITYDQHIGQQISRVLPFADSDHRVVSLGQLFNAKPTLLVFGYYHCPMLCTLINDGLIESLQELRLNVGHDFNVISVSVDPHETPEVAAAKKTEYLRRYGRDGAENGWHFLTGDEPAIAQLANEAGFRYAYDEGAHEYAHPSGFIVLTPEGRISRYFFGVNYEPNELRAAILKAGADENGSPIKQLILLCYHYSPITGRYGELVLIVLRSLGVATFLALVAGLIYLTRSGGKRAAAPEHG